MSAVFACGVCAATTPAPLPPPDTRPPLIGTGPHVLRTAGVRKKVVWKVGRSRLRPWMYRLGKERVIVTGRCGVVCSLWHFNSQKYSSVPLFIWSIEYQIVVSGELYANPILHVLEVFINPLKSPPGSRLRCDQGNWEPPPSYHYAREV